METMKRYFDDFYSSYGVLGLVATLSVMIKMVLFYSFIGVSANLIPVFIVSYVLLYLFFASFKNKWIPAVIFALFSIIMFADVMYSSFFGRYLSVDMLAAATMLGEITDSIAEVFRIQFMLLFVDVILIFFCLVKRRLDSKQEAAFDDGISIESMINEMAENEDEGKAEGTLIGRNKGRTKIAQKERSVAVGFVISHARPLLGVLIIVLLIINITGSALVTSISNQEIITYRFKDIATTVFRTGQVEGLHAFHDTYRHQISGPFFGIAQDMNLIVIQVESLQTFVIGMEYNGQEVTPNLNRLLEGNAAFFDNFYQQLGSGNTSDAEFAINHSLIGTLRSYTNRLYGNTNYFRGLPAMLRDRGYDTAFFHAFEHMDFWHRDTALPNWGFNRFYGGLNDRPGGGVFSMNEWIGWGLSDTYFFDETLGFMEGMPEPFYSFIATLTSHHPFIMPENRLLLELLPEDEGTMVGQYLQSVKFADYALGRFFEGLRERGWYYNSIIAIYGDHMGLPMTDDINEVMERLLGRPYDFDIMMNVPLIISIPGADADISGTRSVAGGKVDFLPTIAYLMGFESLPTLYLGNNLFYIQHGLVPQHTHMLRGSFFTNDIAFVMSRDGVFRNGRAWDINTLEPVPLDDVYQYFLRSIEIIHMSEYILRSDAIRRVFLDGEDIGQAFELDVSRPHPPVITIAGTPSEHANTIEAIQRSHDDGARHIRIQMGWTEKIDEDEDDPNPIVVNDDGEVLMTHHELIEWMYDNPDTQIIVAIERSGDFFIREMRRYNPVVSERFIMELPQLYDHTGRYDSILNITDMPQSIAEIKAFIERNNVWAIMMTYEDSVGRFAELLESDNSIYIIGEPDGIIRYIN